MKLSIIIPMYKVEPYIEKCLLSCTNQEGVELGKDYEILCVNDGSPDKSAEIARSIASKHEGIRVIDRENGGLSAARNTGISNAKGDYVFFLDSDDWIADNCLLGIISKLKEEKPDILAICAANMIGDNPVRRISHENETPRAGIEVLVDRISPCAPFSITRRALLNEHNLRFYEGIYHEDSEFTPRLYYYSKKVSFTNEIIYFVYQNPNSITRSINPKKSFDVINVVCPRIHNFSKEFTGKTKTIFDDRISHDINTALSRTKELDKKNIQKLNTDLADKRYLFEHLKKSSIFKYKIEGMIFSLFPHHSVQIYWFLQKFH